MNLIRPSFKIRGNVDGSKILKSIESAGRTCYKSETKITLESSEKFMSMILKRGHESVIEHEIISVRIVCDRGVSHEIVRHRLASYSQESTRYCDYAGGHITFIIPPWVAKIHAMTGEHNVCPTAFLDSGTNDWLLAMWQSENTYKMLREYGWKPEQARSVLPNSLKTEIVCTMNLREWRHFFKMRADPAAHPQMREIAVPMLEEFRRLVPVVFNHYI